MTEPRGEVEMLRDRSRSNSIFRDDLITILGTIEGRRFFKRLLKDCHVTNPKFVKDPYELYSSEGRRRLAMSYLFLIAKDDPMSLISMIEGDLKNKPLEDDFI